MTDDVATDILPTWSPGGEAVAVSSYRSGNIDVFLQRADAGDTEKALVATPRNERVSDWSRDGNYVLYSLLGPRNDWDIWYLQRNRDSKWEPHPFLEGPASERAPKLSPCRLSVG